MMSATPNSGGRLAPDFDQFTTDSIPCNQGLSRGRSYRLALVIHLSILTWFSAAAIGAPEREISYISDLSSVTSPALRDFQETSKRYSDEPQDARAAWQFGKACFDLAEDAPSKAERARLADLGIAACKKAVTLDDQSGPAHYYLGMNLGQLARTKGLGALKIVGQLRSAFERARELDDRQDNAGPDRNLGLLFRDAPSWTIGDRKAAQEHLVKAVALARDYPDNRLELIEGYLKWGDRISAQSEFETLESLWPKLHEKYSDPKWEKNWKEWESRFEGFKKKIDKTRKKKS